MINLTVQAVVNGFKSSKGNIGTLIIFNELHKKGDMKDKSIVTWNGNPDHRLSSTKGWTFDEDEDRVNAPIISDEDVQEHKLSFAHSLGIEIRL